MYVRIDSLFSTTMYPIDFTLGRVIAEDPRKHILKREVVWASGFSRKLRAIPEATSDGLK